MAGIKVEWKKDAAGTFSAYHDGQKIGYIHDRGGGYWSASGPGVYFVTEGKRDAKATVVEGLREWLRGRAR
jgi:hypothetical protein